MKRYLIIISSFFLVVTYLNSQTLITDSVVYGTWKKENSPYLIFNNITVPFDSSLTIEHGVKIEFQGYYEFTVLGDFTIDGKSDDKVLFTVADTTGFYDTSVEDGAWQGIFINSSYLPLEDRSMFYLNHVIIEYVKDFTVGFATDTAKVGGGIEFFNCRSEHTFTENLIVRNNYSSANGGGIRMQYGSLRLKNCFIYNNVANGGGGIFSQSSGPHISNSIIVNNSSQKGGGIETNVGEIEIYNCLVSNNKSQKASIIHLGGGKGTITNSILWNIENNHSYLKDYGEDTLLIENCIVSFLEEQTRGTFINCLNEDPKFKKLLGIIGAGVDTDILDWSLGSNQSPAIDAGVDGLISDSTDILGMQRIFNESNGKIDLGPFEFQGFPSPRDIIFEKNEGNTFLLGQCLGTFKTKSNFQSSYKYTLSANATAEYDNTYFSINNDSLFYSSDIGTASGSLKFLVRTTDTLNQFIEKGFEFSSTELVDIQSFNLKKEQIVFPNPTSGFLNFNSPIRSLEIYSFDGSLIKKVNLNFQTNKFNLSDLKNGVYFIKIEGKTETHTIKIIKTDF